MGKFEESMVRLEEIVNLMESGEQALDETLRLFKEGMRLSELCSATLSDAQRKVEMLVKKADGSYDKAPLEKEMAEEKRASDLG
ncbi:exodeoxyribonuclease VII small subunit [bacterium]|nr:exodeoxyribonuclease VII small subunit [bacterium]